MQHRILVVEDNAANAHLIKAIMTVNDLDAVVVGSGEEALAEVQEDSYSLIVMDIMLPGISGVETARRIRLLPDVNIANLPIFALTAVGDLVREECSKIGIHKVF